MAFDEDLARGQEIEHKVAEVIRKKYPSTSLVNKFKGYDIWVPEIHKSIEVKYDPRSNQTGNIVVEIEMNEKPSGLMSTTADYWVFYDDNEFVLIKPNDIIYCIFLNKLQYVTFTGAGDKAPKKAFLIKKDVLFTYGKKIG